MRLSLKTVAGVFGYWRQGPAKLIDPVIGDWAGSGARSSAGKTVTVDGALAIVPAFACIRVISQAIGSMSCETKVWDGRSMKPARDHPLWWLLHDMPNADMTATELWSAMVVALLTWGNAYAEISRVFGRVVALTPLRPDWLTARRDGRGAIVYAYTAPGEEPREIAEGDILHCKYVSTDGLTGLSPVALARNTLGITMAAEEVAGKLFANGMRANGYLSGPQMLNKQQRQDARTYLAGFQGSANAGSIPILEGGWKFESFSMPARDAELLATRSFQIEDVCRIYGVPPWIIGHTEKSTSWGTGLESQMLGFYTLTLRPLIKALEGAIARRLLSPAERGRVEVDFNVESLLRADSQGRATFLKTMVEAGIYTRNEARDHEGLEPKAGGDDLTVQSNQLPLGTLGKATTRADPALSGDLMQ